MFKVLFQGIQKLCKFLGAFIFRYWKQVLKILLIVIVLLLVWFAVWVSTFYFDYGATKLSHENQDNSKNVVTDVTGLYPVETKGIIVPHTTQEIQEAVKNNDRVSIGGGRYSMGGQTASTKAVQIDMREFKKVISFSTSTKEITVQAGIRWREIQDLIDPYDLSIQIMQTYSNFTVGGSLSVNVHGRYIGLGPVIMSVKKIQVVLADGSVVEATPDTNKEIFYSAIGGMGGMGVITEVTLGLADNINVERSRVKMPITEYKEYFFNNVRNSSTTLFHNGDIYPMDFDSVSAVSWKETDKAPTTETRLIPRKQEYWLEKVAWVIMSEWPWGKEIREYIFEPLIYRSPAVHTRNYEASYDVAELEPKNRDTSTYVLQEYFVPVEKFDEFYPKMKEVFVENNVNVSNVSIRHAQADPGALLAWAKKESFAFVVYYKQGTDDASKDRVARWTREMIDQVLSVGGSYYLPYQPHATELQFLRAYPRALDFFDLKKKYDPTNKFTNSLWDKYYDPAQLDELKLLKHAEEVASTTPEYIRASDNMFLSVPEWYIVYSAGEYANVLRDALPSTFDYRKASKEYWSEYEQVQKLARGTAHQNADYNLVLKVIGWSFTFENNVKWAYENTIGRMSEWSAGNVRVEEDEFAAKVARDYEVFIYDYPWYDFPYASYNKALHTLPSDEIDRPFGQKLRRFERKVFLTIELGFKTFYSWVIRTATHTKFGVQDDVIHAIVEDQGTARLVSAPHYHPFTKTILGEMSTAYEKNTQFRVLEIAGNDEITLSYLDEVGTLAAPFGKELFRSTEVISVENGTEQYKERITTLIPVKDLFELYSYLRDRGIAVSHLYDY